jgi:hypothetical protein
MSSTNLMLLVCCALSSLSNAASVFYCAPVHQLLLGALIMLILCDVSI